MAVATYCPGRPSQLVWKNITKPCNRWDAPLCTCPQKSQSRDWRLYLLNKSIAIGGGGQVKCLKGIRNTDEVVTKFHLLCLTGLITGSLRAIFTARRQEPSRSTCRFSPGDDTRATSECCRSFFLPEKILAGKFK